MRTSVGMSPSPTSLLTPHGLRLLYQDTEGMGDVRLQVLGVYRYLADPALKQRLGRTFADAVEVFDVLLSDGHYKMKAVVAPNLHSLIWTRELSARCVVRVSKFQVLQEDPTDAKQRQRVVILSELTVESLVIENHKQLQFLSTVHPREVELLPLVGDRRYYLPLHSDHYTLNWACSFTNGVPHEDSPLDVLEINWAAKYASLETEGQSLAVEWNSTPDYCDSLFIQGNKKICAIQEALVGIKLGNRRQLNPPIIGAIQVKSKIMNLGKSDIANPFPFVFNAVVVDTTSVFEVAFFGSMCAKYYLSLQEGDLIQFRGYSAVDPLALQYTKTTTPLIFYPHESTGTALHVPKNHWGLLKAIKLAPHLLEMSEDISQEARPSWLECSFVNSLSTLYWSTNAIYDRDVMYFDFVGVLSNVGKIIRGRKRRLDADCPEVTEFRWVKIIDGSSSQELVVQLGECSQPAVFRSLEAGNTLMITKLQWVVLPGGESENKPIQYARTSMYSILRVNEAVLPFQSVEECNLNVFFANNVNKSAAAVSRTSRGESKLTAHIEKKYRPRNKLPTDVNQFKETFGLQVCSFSELSTLLVNLEAYEHKHVGFVGQVTGVKLEENPVENVQALLLEVNESSNEEKILTVAVSINPLYQTPVIKGSVKSITPPESLSLIRLLPTDVVDDMQVQALKEHQSSELMDLTDNKGPKLTLPFIEQYLTTSKREFLFSLQLYQDGSGEVTWEVDAILAVPRANEEID